MRRPTTRRLRRAVFVAGIAAALVAGTVAASTGASWLQAFEPEPGTISQRVTRIEGFLESNSREVASIVQPATCPTAEEARYLEALRADLESLADAFDALSSEEDLDVITDLAVAMFERRPPLSIRGQLLHVEARRLSVSTLTLTSAMQTEIDDGTAGANALARLTPALTRLGVELVVLIYLVEQFCDGDSPAPTASPTAARGTPTATRTPTPTPTVAAQHPLAMEFGCQWIMDTYRSVAMAGRDLAILNLSTAMTAKRLEQGSFIFVGTGDAAAALRECEAQGGQ